MIKGHLQGQKVNLKVKWLKIWFWNNKARSMCNTSFSCDFDWTINLVIWGHPQGQKVNFKVEYDFWHIAKLWRAYNT